MNAIIVSHARKNNLQDVSVSIPMNQFTSFVGKSGSGKSTLAVDVIYSAYIKASDNVQVHGTAALFKQISSLSIQRSAVGTFMLGATAEYSDDDVVSDLIPETLSGLLQHNELQNIAKMLELSELPATAAVNTLSLTVYNKLRFFKMLLEKDADVLVVDELAAGMAFQEAKIVGELFHFLVTKGFTILAIEHSLPVIMSSDFIVELGPDAGVNGGKILFTGSFSDYSKTKRWKDICNAGSQIIPSKAVGKKQVEVTNINYHSFFDTSVSIPLHAVVNIIGKSGSGKSSMLDILHRALDKSTNAWKNHQGIDGEIRGKSYMRRAYVIDQSPIGKNALSTVATYSGIMDSLRKIYADASSATGKRFSVSDFSYNGKDHCPRCKGRGYFIKEVDDNELFISCDACGGLRYTEKVLAILDCGLNIGQLLQTPCEELYKIYGKTRRNAPITRKIGFINDVGLSYICLGQPSGTLSGGESQRLKITKELAKKLGDRCVFILDDPTKGLHTFNLPDMMKVLRLLVSKNNSVVISDNNPFMIRNSDYLILIDDGRILYEGTPDSLPKKYHSYFGLDLLQNDSR